MNVLHNYYVDATPRKYWIGFQRNDISLPEQPLTNVDA